MAAAALKWAGNGARESVQGCAWRVEKGLRRAAAVTDTTNEGAPRERTIRAVGVSGCYTPPTAAACCHSRPAVPRGAAMPLSHYASQPTPLGWPGGRRYTG